MAGKTAGRNLCGRFHGCNPLSCDTEKKIVIRDIDDVVLNEILSYNRG